MGLKSLIGPTKKDKPSKYVKLGLAMDKKLHSKKKGPLTHFMSKKS